MEKVLLSRMRNYFTKQPLVLLAYLYGSYAKGSEREDSDIDVAILVDEKKGNSLTVQLDATADLSKLLGREVEVQNLGAVDVAFAHRVLSEGKLIFARSIDYKIAYETYILRQYFDLKPFYDAFYETLGERAKRGLIGRVSMSEELL